MAEKHGADREKWPTYDSDLCYSTGIDDQNVHGDNYGLGALGKINILWNLKFIFSFVR